MRLPHYFNAGEHQICAAYAADHLPLHSICTVADCTVSRFSVQASQEKAQKLLWNIEYFNQIHAVLHVFLPQYFLITPIFAEIIPKESTIAKIMPLLASVFLLQNNEESICKWIFLIGLVSRRFFNGGGWTMFTSTITYHMFLFSKCGHIEEPGVSDASTTSWLGIVLVIQTDKHWFNREWCSVFAGHPMMSGNAA